MSSTNRLCTSTTRILLSVLLLGLSGVSLSQGTPYEQAFTAYQNQQFDDAEILWRDLAEAGDVNAQYALGVMHLRREASDSTPVAAFSWFEKAATQGHATAMFNLGVAYWEGTGVDQNKNKALDLWQEAATKGDSGAQYNLGLAYYIGEEKAPDLELARSWISQAATQNHPEAQRILKAIDSEISEATIASTSSASVSEVATAAGATEQAAAGSDEVAESATETTVETVAAAEPALEQYWKTTGDRSQLFSQPNGVQFRELPPGTPVEINGQDGGWARITVPDGLRTWVFSKFIEIDEDRGVITGDAVRVRPEPSTDNETSPPLGQYRRGDRVDVLQVDGDWVQIRAPKEISAWIRVDDIIKYRDTAENRAESWQRARDNGA